MPPSGGNSKSQIPLLRIVLSSIIVISILLAWNNQPFAISRRVGTQQPIMDQWKVNAEERATLPITGGKASSEMGQIGKWMRFEASFNNDTWSGNPFDLEFTATFEHIPTGRTVTQIGFYAGDNTWKLFFMPDELGEWVFVTSSPDPDLHNKTGSFTCIPSDLPGRLIGAGNRWMLEDTEQYLAPIMLPTRQWFKSTDTGDGIRDFALWAKNTAGALVIGTTLVYFDHEQPAVPYVKGQEGEIFNIEMWDRLNNHYDMLRDQGMGFYIMFYSDDRESPNSNNIKEMSQEELRLFRYAVARFSAYPIVIWDTGIDIGETRSTEWINWFVNWFQNNDPWNHPVSSRTGGGSGGIVPDNASYYSDGSSVLPDHSDVVSDWRSRNVPTAYTDRWREDYGRGNFTRERIRQALWEVGLVGGTAVYVSGDENGGYLTENYEIDFQAAPDMGIRNSFFEKKIENFGSIEPYPDLIVSGRNAILVAVPGSEYIVYDSDGGSIKLDLSASGEPLYATWFNPRTGGTIPVGVVPVSDGVEFVAPIEGDVVLYISKEEISGGSSCEDCSYKVNLPLCTK